MEKIKVAIVGVGKQAQEDHLPAVMKLNKFKLTALCDINKETIEQIKAKYELKINLYTDYVELAQKELIDLVILSLPHDEYLKAIEIFAEKGIHIFKEKPLGISKKEVDIIRKIIKDNNVKLYVNVQRRHNPIYCSFFQFLPQIGKPFFLDIIYTINVLNPGDGWRGQIKKAGGGCLIDMGYHMIDLLVWYFDLPDSISMISSSIADYETEYDAEDTASVQFAYNSGLHGIMVISRSFRKKQEKLELIGTDGSISLERGLIKRMDKQGEIIEQLERKYSWPSAAYAQLEYMYDQIYNDKIGWEENFNEHVKHAIFIDRCYNSERNRR